MSKKTRILAIGRYFLIEDFRENLAPFGEHFEVIYASDGGGRVDHDLRQDFYAGIKSQPKALLDPEMEEDVRLRCRLLRNLPKDVAIHRLRAMAVAIHTLLDKVSPACVIGPPVDEYVMDLTSRFCELRGIRFIGFCASFFPGRIQVLLYSKGRPFDVIQPEQALITKISDQISQDRFRQSYILAPSLRYRDHLRAYLRFQIKRVVFPLKAWLENNPLALHYTILPYIAEHRRLSDFPTKGLFAADWQGDLTQARTNPGTSGRRVIYVPLSYFPESTNDYWVPNTKALHYQEMILDLIHRAAKSHTVMVKEHIHMIGCRDRTFHKAISAIPNVIHVPPTEFSNLVLAESDVLLLGAGSSGVEATLRGKPVLSYSETSYWFAASRAAGLDLDRLDQFDQVVSDLLSNHRPLDEGEKREFLATCLASTLRWARNGKKWPIVEPDDMRALLQKASLP